MGGEAFASDDVRKGGQGSDVLDGAVDAATARGREEDDPLAR